MPLQLSISFDSVHRHENSPESQKTLDLRREDFNKNCWLALKRMLNGERLTVSGTAVLGENHISSLPRRALDLIEVYHIPVKRELAEVNGVKQKYKWYYISEQDRAEVMNRIINWMKAA